MTDVHWVPQSVVLAIHGRLLSDYGGPEGVRDTGLLESALARPQQLHAYGTPDIYALAASYTVGLIQNHPFVDGNKRIGFMVGYLFLARNGHLLDAGEADVAQVVFSVAAGEMVEDAYAAWLRKYCRRA